MFFLAFLFLYLMHSESVDRLSMPCCTDDLLSFAVFVPVLVRFVGHF